MVFTQNQKFLPHKHDISKNHSVRPDTCTSLLEAQAACGAIIDPRPRQKGGERYYIEDALDVDLIPENLDSVLKRAEMSVRGYTQPKRLLGGGLQGVKVIDLNPNYDDGERTKINVYQGFQQGLVAESTAFRCLRAQLATGGVIDPKVGHRVPDNIAFERGLLDFEFHRSLNEDLPSFYNPATKTPNTYVELQNFCLEDPDTGLLLIPYDDVLDGPEPDLPYILFKKFSPWPEFGRFWTFSQ